MAAYRPPHPRTDDVEPALAAADTRAQLSGPALRGFFSLAERWRLTVGEQLALLGWPGRSTFFRWRQTAAARTAEGGDEGAAVPTLSADTLMRISYLLGIFAGLERWLGATPAEADAWIARSNTDAPFFGRRPLDILCAGDIAAFAQVRGYLDALAGGPLPADGVVPTVLAASAPLDTIDRDTLLRGFVGHAV